MSSFWPFEGPGINGDQEDGLYGYSNVILVVYQPLKSQYSKFNCLFHLKYNILLTISGQFTNTGSNL